MKDEHLLIVAVGAYFVLSGYNPLAGASVGFGDDDAGFGVSSGSALVGAAVPVTPVPATIALSPFAAAKAYALSPERAARGASGVKTTIEAIERRKHYTQHTKEEMKTQVDYS